MRGSAWARACTRVKGRLPAIGVVLGPARPKEVAAEASPMVTAAGGPKGTGIRAPAMGANLGGVRQRACRSWAMSRA